MMVLLLLALVLLVLRTLVADLRADERGHREPPGSRPPEPRWPVCR